MWQVPHVYEINLENKCAQFHAVCSVVYNILRNACCFKYEIKPKTIEIICMKLTFSSIRLHVAVHYDGPH